MRYIVKQLTGVNRNTGELMPDHAHIHQSIDDILTTPIGTRVMRREYGSLMPDLLDRPMNDALIMQIYAAIAIAVTKNEPRIRLAAIKAEYGTNGKMIFSIEYERLHPTSSAIGLYKFEVIKR
ncbi:MAG: hypothetical protein CR975_02095 [Gammaproteobacteria bacterium]|nr:MAG: hypothetical protein CR975_02095 [Gammaproteobacteria bacterium]